MEIGNGEFMTYAPYAYLKNKRFEYLNTTQKLRTFSVITGLRKTV